VTITIMAAVARNGVIGSHGAIPWRLPADLKRFREVTIGHVLVMGRRTYESIGRPLPGRTTVVLTRQRDWEPTGGRPPGLRVAEDLPTGLAVAADLGGEIFVQGGAGVYAEALALADRMLITWVDAEPAGDTIFPDVDWSQWEQVSAEPFDGGTWSTYRRAGSGRK
jgi:dihydrofolate reductase